MHPNQSTHHSISRYSDIECEIHEGNLNPQDVWASFLASNNFNNLSPTYHLLEISRSLIGRLQAEGDRETLRDRARREFEAWSNRPKGSTSLSSTLDWDLAKPGPESWRREFRDFCWSILSVNGLDPIWILWIQQIAAMSTPK